MARLVQNTRKKLQLLLVLLINTFAFAFAFAPLAGRLGPGPRGTEVGDSEGQGLEFHALYINMRHQQTTMLG